MKPRCATRRPAQRLRRGGNAEAQSGDARTPELKPPRISSLVGCARCVKADGPQKRRRDVLPTSQRPVHHFLLLAPAMVPLAGPLVSGPWEQTGELPRPPAPSPAFFLARPRILSALQLFTLPARPQSSLQSFPPSVSVSLRRVSHRFFQARTGPPGCPVRPNKTSEQMPQKACPLWLFGHVFCFKGGSLPLIPRALLLSMRRVNSRPIPLLASRARRPVVPER
ncbi:hypothetical protein BDV95DRAFT_227180 [Massariosphaeria phaeospora]|uniref:Uncharacterized protein n=1 Tax=Massariosphaeria phaeospora TaxID=100035 RepID=A0A7C8MGT0_9PLEO|nr:hypothetical protein BDV95DRAFT_227180 [Massariosphaeria phaeospora]